jgi:hypothetical protein
MMSFTMKGWKSIKYSNEPVLVMCPKTKQTILPSYMRGRLSSASSGGSGASSRSGFSFHSANSQVAKEG